MRDVRYYARLLLAARGVPRTPESLAGAILEAHKDQLIVGLIEGLAKAKVPTR